MDSDGEASELNIIDLEGGDVRRIALRGEEIFPHWSPDGSRIAFTSVVEGTLRLVSYDVEGGIATDLLPSVGRDVRPRWSPDGSRITFFSRRDTSGEDDALTPTLISSPVRRSSPAKAAAKAS